MKSLRPFLFIFLLFYSCNFKEKVAEMKTIDHDLETYFNYDKINVNISWGTEEENNNIIVTFYQYPLSTIAYSKLKETSNEVIDRLITKNPKFQDLFFIEVRFTEENNSNNVSSFTSFKINDLYY
jgi:hypothetical protein